MEKNIFQHKYFDLYFYYNGIQFGILNTDDNVVIRIPFLIISLKKSEIPFLKNYGDFITGILVGWITLIIISRLVF